METLDVKVLGSREEMPEIDDSNFFHSRTLFDICTQTPGYTPYMVVIEDGQARVLCHLLAIIRRRGSLLPPYLYSQCRVYGEGVYASPDYPQEELFVRMLKRTSPSTSCRYCSLRLYERIAASRSSSCGRPAHRYAAAL